MRKCLLIAFLFLAAPAVLAQRPVIDSLNIDEARSELVVFTQQALSIRHVTVQGTQLVFPTRTSSSLRMTIPLSGPGSSGSVVLHSSTGDTSEPVSILSYKGSFSSGYSSYYNGRAYREGGGESANISIHFRFTTKTVSGIYPACSDARGSRRQYYFFTHFEDGRRTERDETWIDSTVTFAIDDTTVTLEANDVNGSITAVYRRSEQDSLRFNHWVLSGSSRNWGIDASPMIPDVPRRIEPTATVVGGERESQSLRADVYDLMGRIVVSDRPLEDVMRALPPGCYIIRSGQNIRKVCVF